MTEIEETINQDILKKMEKELNCTFCQNGKYAEMSQNIREYVEKTARIPDVEYRFFDGDIQELKKLVAIVDEDWPQYFNYKDNIFCGFYKNQLASFCCVDTKVECIISTKDTRTGSIGCVGTLPEFRKKGIGLRMVDLATVFLKENGCDKVYISYTHIDYWYKKLGYKTFARFSLN